MHIFDLPYQENSSIWFDKFASSRTPIFLDSCFQANNHLNDFNRSDLICWDPFIEIIQKEFPEFKSIPGEENLSFIKGLNNINKSSIDKALRYLFNEKHDKNIAEGTIRRKFNEYGMW